MIRAGEFTAAAASQGIGLYTGVPCSYLTPLIQHAIAARDVRYIAAANEGDAVALAMGAFLGGERTAVLLQNSGLGNALNPLVSLCAPFRVPVLLVCTWRGDPEGPGDEPQHALMGAITPTLLDNLGIPWEACPGDERALAALFRRAVQHMDATGRSYALLVRKHSIAADGAVHGPSVVLPRIAAPPLAQCSMPRLCRREVLDAIKDNCPGAALVATAGHIGRALHETGDSEQQLYLAGGMGCASSVGLGLAIARPSRPVVVLDGDGAALMRLGAFATIGHYRPPNLVHVVLDNEMHESTGGQATVSPTTDLAAVAAACGYEHIFRADSVASAGEAVARAKHGLVFVHVKVLAEDGPAPPRPRIGPPEGAARFRNWFSSSDSPRNTVEIGGSNAQRLDPGP